VSLIEALDKMSRIFLSLLLVATTVSGVFAQIFDPVEWEYEVKRISESEAELTFIASIESGWHLYAQKIEGDGPIPTSFTFQDLDGAELVGDVSEEEGHTEMDPNFGIELKYFSDEAKFVQKVKVSGTATTIRGELEFMVCNDERCLPPDYLPFEFKVPAVAIGDVTPSEQDHGESQIFEPVTWSFAYKDLGNGEYELQFNAVIEEYWHVYSMHLPEETMTVSTLFEYDSLKGIELIGKVVEPEPITKFDPVNEEELSWFENEVTFTQKIRLSGPAGYVKGAVNFMACDDEKCLAPEWIDFELNISGEVVEESATADDSQSTGGNNKSYWRVFFLAFFSGLGALLTPCVFPMIPLTVSFFTKQSKNKLKGRINAVIYGLFILGIYFSLSLPFHVLEGVDPDIFNQIATNFWLNMVLGVVFIIFAISFFGAFELTLPSSWINKADKASDVGGIVGIFFMAITLVLVSFTCTGPILGGLLGATLSSAGGEAANMLSVGMLGFGLAFGLPFGLFAFFPGWLNSLPKSGGWLNTVKVVFGFLELAFAFKFLSNADLVMQTGILKREIFIAIWIAVFLMLSLYLFKLIRFEHDDDDTKMSIPRALIGALTLTFTIYLVPGLWGAPLKIISGFPPPNFYSEAPGGFGGSAVTTAAPTLNKDGNIVGDPEHCPHGLSCFHDYEEGMAYAKESGKPVLLDFTGWACVNCRKMEEQVWSDPRVLNRLSNEYVLISLYVDEKAELPEEEQIEVKIGEKTRKLRTVGNRWSYFQANRFGNNSQPYYVVLDHEENQLGDPASYDPDIEKYVNWLDAGISAFEASK
jgi:thiol:disulfide interchange protein DsbD